MKKLISSLLAVALCGVALVGCGSDSDDVPPAPAPAEEVFGWHMTSWEVGEEDTEFPKEVYLVFTKDAEQSQGSTEVGTFDLYQDISSYGFVKMTGTYSFDSATQQLEGEYSDGVAWAYSYTVSGTTQISSLESASEDTMTLTAVEDATFKTVYESLQIPATVIDNAMEADNNTEENALHSMGVAGIRIL